MSKDTPKVEPPKDEIDRLYTDLENSFISFLRDDPTRTTTVPATMAAQHFEYRIERYIKLQQEALLAKVEVGLPNRKTDISGYHEDHNPEQLTRITAMNRQHNATLGQVKTAIDKLRLEL